MASTVLAELSPHSDLFLYSQHFDNNHVSSLGNKSNTVGREGISPNPPHLDLTKQEECQSMRNYGWPQDMKATEGQGPSSPGGIQDPSLPATA